MSAISTYLNNILSAIYGKDVRQSIHDAISQCYDDVTSPSLATAAFDTAIKNAVADGTLTGFTVEDDGAGTVTLKLIKE